MLKLILLALGVALFSTNVRADEDGSYVNYENIVNELKASAEEKPPAPTDPADDYGWETVAIHGGVGLATSWNSLTVPSGASGAGLLTGVTVNFGVNLFSKYWRAEGAFTNFSQGNLDSNLKADLKEFELRLIYLPMVRDNMSLRIGSGLAARYMDVDALSNGQWQSYEATTPSALFMLGFERKLSKTVALGPDLSYRSSLVGDTFDKSGWDATFRLNAMF